MKNFYEINRALSAKKKVLLLIPLFVFALTASSTPISVDPGTNNLQAAIATASAGDVLELSTGTYTEAGNFSINKDITIQAANGSFPVIEPSAYFKIEGGAEVTFRGVKIDGKNSVDHFLRAHDKSNGEESVVLENCELTRYTSYLLYTQKDARRWNAITIRNCYIHNIAKYAVFIGNEGTNEHQSCNSLTIENSTFADITGSYDVIYYDAPDAEHTTTLNVNHCTFYNHPKRAIYWQKSTNLSVSNCVFAQPAAISYKSVECSGGTITNCLSYKTGGYSSAATRTDNITGNPYFLNTTPGSYDFSLWTTSPARDAGNDDKNLGDLRWTSDPSTHNPIINITDEATNSLKVAVEAALPEDIIILADGTYEESESISIDKDLTIKAADGVNPVVKPIGEFAISNAADVKIQNIKFDGSDQSGVSNFIKAADDKNNKLTIEGCEFYTFAQNAIATGSSQHFSACTIDDCYFHGCTKSAIYFPNTSKDYNACDALHITNSTFANFTGFNAPVIAFYNKNETTNSPAENDAELRVDHCTFYNLSKTDASSTYGFVDSRKSANVLISNCIFANPTANQCPATYCYGGYVDNSLIFNTKGHRSSDQARNGISADPLFTDATNGDFTFPGNWTTMVLSPARGAATDGTDLGDPRWYSDEVVPSTDLSSAYALTADKAVLSGNIIYETGAPDPQTPYIRYDKSNKTAGTAKWKINVTEACYISATINMANNEWNKASDATFENHKHIFGVELFDEDNHSIGSLVEGIWTDDGYTGYPTIDLPGMIHIEEPGVYTAVLTNTRNNTRCGVDDVTLASGGAVKNIPTTSTPLSVADALFSSNCKRADGKISFIGNAVASEWVRWNVHVSTSDYYNVSLNSATSSGHVYSVAFYDGSTLVDEVSESWHNTTGDLPLGMVFLPAGDYVMEVKNSVSENSNAQLVSVAVTTVEISTINLPTPSDDDLTLDPNAALRTSKTSISGGELYFNEGGDPRGQWAQWKVSVDEDRTYLFTMNVTSEEDHHQSYRITIYDTDKNEIAVYDKNPGGSGDYTITRYFFLEAGTYFVKVENTYSHSNGHMVSLVVSIPDDILVVDEAAEDDSYLVAHKDQTADIQIIRTLVPDMYNTICLPFPVNSLSALKEALGCDFELLQLSSATMDGTVLTLEFDTDDSMYQGKPFVIKPAKTVVNPVFVSSSIARTDAGYSTKGVATFRGTVYKDFVPAGANNLFLGAENKLYFSNSGIDILGLRGYFSISPAAGAPTRARFVVAQKDVVTEVELINGALPEAFSGNVGKYIIDGQIVLIHDGVEYNVLGVRIK